MPPRPDTNALEDADSIHSSTGYWVTLLARAMESDFERRLGSHGVSRPAFAILSAIKNDQKTTPTALASFVGIDPAAITRHLDRLEEQGLVLRTRSDTDRRSVVLNLTRKASRLVSRLVAESRATNAKFLEGLTVAEKQHLHDLIRKMLANSDRPPGDL